MSRGFVGGAGQGPGGVEVPERLRRPINREVLGYLEGCSAHSDVAEAFSRALEGLGEVECFCPDPAAYRYVLAATRGVIFGVAVGQGTIGLRLWEGRRSRALAAGAGALPEAGLDWVAMTLFRPGWPRVDLAYWVRQAYVGVRESRRIQGV